MIQNSSLLTNHRVNADQSDSDDVGHFMTDFDTVYENMMPQTLTF